MEDGNMEIRIWIPESWSAFKYMIKHPSSWVIGVYGSKRYFELKQKYIAANLQNAELEKKIMLKNQDLKEMGKRISELKRAK